MKGGRLKSTPNRKLKAEIGEDPERYLNRPIDYDDQWPMARIKGIDYIEIVRAWKAIERKLGRDDGDPREQIMALLDEREEFLRENGERPDRLEPLDEPRDIPPKRVTINGVPADEVPATAAEKLQKIRESAATDGGSS